MICIKCGAELPDDASECPSCGQAVCCEDEYAESPVITTEERIIPFPDEGVPAVPPPVIRAREKEIPRRGAERAWCVVSLLLTAAACTAAFYPICRDFGRICLDVSGCVERGDVLSVEGMISVSLLVLGAFAADIALSVGNVLRRGGKNRISVFAFAVLLAVWLYARINEAPARFAAGSVPAALLNGSRLFYIKDSSLIALALLSLALCAQAMSYAAAARHSLRSRVTT